MKFISIGNLCLDVILRYSDRMPKWGTELFFQESELRLGGQAVNFALTTSKLGNKTLIVSGVGGDSVAGRMMSEVKQTSLIDTRFLG
jgi:sugar/nucleoside kinase (ribokinase family)